LAACRRDDEDQHSTPTRRSSDHWASVLHFEMRYRSLDYFLEKTAAPTVLELSTGFSLRGLDYARKHPDASYIDTDLPAIISQKRSEEHTSELQSRENLVCRLLLE